MSSALARRRSRAEPAPSFALRHAYAGVHRLPAALTINGATVYPTLRYKGGDATATQWPAWGYGETLAVAGTGTAPTLNAGSPLYGPSDDSVRGNGASGGGTTGRTYNGTTGLGAVGTNDFVIEYIGDIHVLAPVMASKSGGGGASVGWVLLSNSGTVAIYIYDGAGVLCPSAALTLTQFSHVIGFADRSGYFQWYVNGGASGVPTAISARSGSISGTSAFSLLGYNLQTATMAGRFSYLALWQGDAWLDSHLQPAIAAARYAALMGGPTVAWGSPVPDVMTRSTPTYVDKWEAGGTRRIYYVGANWPALHSRKDSAARTVVGIAPDLARTTLALQSQALSTTWTKVALTSITNDSGVGPDGTATLDGIIGDATDAFHGVSQACTLTAVNYCLSAWFRAGNKSWAYIDDTTVAGATGYFDLATGVVGTKGAGAGTIGIEDWGGSLYRCWITVLGTAAAHTVRFGAAHADGDNDFSGDASTINSHVGCINVTAADAPTAYIPTTTSTVTRTAETHRYPGLANLGGVGSEKQGGFRFKVLATPAFLPSAVVALVGASDGSYSDELIAVTVGTDGYVDVTTTHGAGAAGASAGPNTNVLDGAIHEIVVAWAPNSLTCWVDGVWGTVDSACDLPGDLDRLEIGQNRAGASQGRVLIADLKVFNRPLASSVIRGSGWR
jgi:hypothetical protein